MGPVIEVGGTKPGSKGSLLGHRARCIDVRRLPNPHGVISRGALGENLADIERWVRRGRGGEMFDAFVGVGAAEVLAGRSVRVQCVGGRHRSQAVARAIERQVGPAAGVTVSLLDAPRCATGSGSNVPAPPGPAAADPPGGHAKEAEVQRLRIELDRTTADRTLTKNQRKNQKRRLKHQLAQLQPV